MKRLVPVISGTIAIIMVGGLSSANANIFADLVKGPNFAIERAIRDAQENKLKTQTPPSMQPALGELFLDLRKTADDQLDLLRIASAADNPCSLPETPNCRGLPATNVTVAIDKEFEHRQTIAARTDTNRSLYTSSTGAGVSIFSLLLSFIASFRKPKAPELST